MLDQAANSEFFLLPWAVIQERVAANPLESREDFAKRTRALSLDEELAKTAKVRILTEHIKSQSKGKSTWQTGTYGRLRNVIDFLRSRYAPRIGRKRQKPPSRRHQLLQAEALTLLLGIRHASDSLHEFKTIHRVSIEYSAKGANMSGAAPKATVDTHVQAFLIVPSVSVISLALRRSRAM